MALNRSNAALTVALLVGTTSSAFAAFSPGMRDISSDPSGWGFATNIASLDSASTGFNYAANSGFSWSFLGAEQDRTDVITDVYRITSAHTFNPGGGAQEITVSPGELVFAYRLTLVEANAATVTSLREAQVLGVPAFGFGVDVLDSTLLRAQGFVTNGHGRNPTSGNISDAAPFGSSLDFEWGGGLAQNLLNDQTIVMLMFTDPATIGQGVMSLTAPAGQLGGLTGSTEAGGNVVAPPVLIPVVPSPGAIMLCGIGMGVFASRRRGRA